MAPTPRGITRKANSSVLTTPRVRSVSDHQPNSSTSKDEENQGEDNSLLHILSPDIRTTGDMPLFSSLSQESLLRAPQTADDEDHNIHQGITCATRQLTQLI